MAPIDDPKFGMFEKRKEEDRELLEEQGHKYDGGKTRYELLPPIALEGAAKVLTYGNAKYAPDPAVCENNWSKGMRWTRLVGACMRHQWAWMRGEELDPESGLHHLDHAVSNLMMLRSLVETYPKGDDRPTNNSAES